MLECFFENLVDQQYFFSGSTIIRSYDSMKQSVPGPTGRERLRLLHLYIRSGDQISETMTAPMQRQLRDKYGPVIRLRIPFGSDLYFLTTPKGVRQVFDAEPSGVRRSEARVEDLTMMFGPGIIQAEGDRWRERRSTIAPVLGGDLAASVAPRASSIARNQLESWAQKSSPVETTQVASRYIVETLGTVLFGRAFTDHNTELMSALATFGEVFPREASLVPNAPRVIPTPHNRRVRAAQDQLKTAVDSLLEVVSSSPPNDTTCVASILLAASGLDTESVRAELRGVFVAGLVTSKALSCALYRVAAHENIQSTARDQTVVTTDTAPHTDGSGFIQQVIDEVLRLHPPLPPDVRTPTEPLCVEDYEIPPGAKLVVNQLPIHHHPQIWTDPLAFRPARFDPERSKERDPYSFFPFGRGPRRCPGREIAYAVLREFLAELLGEYVVHPAEPEPNVGANPTDPEPVAIRLQPVATDSHIT